MTSDQQAVVEAVKALMLPVIERLDRLESKQAAPKREYTPDEVAKVVERAPFTVREWARLKRIKSRRDARGRVYIPHEEYERIVQYRGLPPADS